MLSIRNSKMRQAHTKQTNKKKDTNIQKINKIKSIKKGEIHFFIATKSDTRLNYSDFGLNNFNFFIVYRKNFGKGELIMSSCPSSPNPGITIEVA